MTMVTHLDYVVWRDLLAVPTLPAEDRSFLDSLSEAVTYTPSEQSRINALWDLYLAPEAKR